MIITEFMQNGALDAFLRVRRAEDQLGRGMSHGALGIGSGSRKRRPSPSPNLPTPCCRNGRTSWSLGSWWPCCRA